MDSREHRTSAAIDTALRGQSYLALRAGGVVVLLTECEARALASAVRTLSVLATAPDSARDHIGKAAPGERP